MREMRSRADYESVLKDCRSGKYALVVDWTAEWCAPCAMQHPLLERLEKAYPDIVIVSVDVDEHLKLSDEEDVMSMPTLDWYAKGGERVRRSNGLLTWETLRKYARDVLGR